MFVPLGIDAKLLARAEVFRISDQGVRAYGFRFSPVAKLDGLFILNRLAPIPSDTHQRVDRVGV